MKKVILFSGMALLIFGLFIAFFPELAQALDIDIDNIGSISTGGTAKLNKALGILDILESTWFTILDSIAVLILVAGAFILRSRAPDRWAQYLNLLLAVGLALAAPLIYRIIKEIVEMVR